MAKLFLDPEKPLYTCKSNSCEGCNLSSKLVCHFNNKQLTIFLIMAAPIFVSGGYFVVKFNPFLLIPWILFILTFFGLIEIRVMCSHCPHYAEPELTSLKCWANYGSPKLWKYRPGPMSVLEKIIFYSGFIIMFFFPVVLLLLKQNYLFLIIYLILLTLWKIGLRTFYCKKCMNFACPFNSVDDETREAFFEKNPDIKKAWEK